MAGAGRDIGPQVSGGVENYALLMAALMALVIVASLSAATQYFAYTFCGQVKRLIVKPERAAYQHSAAASLPSPPRRLAKPNSPNGFTFSSTPNDEDIL